MSSMTARLQAMIATLDGMLPDESEYRESVIHRSPSGGTRMMIDEHMNPADLRDWMDAFFSHPERIQIKRFEVKR